MKLFQRDLGGQGKPLVILHGLFGSSKNWITNGKFLSQYRRVIALDLRNHGDSPHSDSHSLRDLVEDLKEFVDTLDEVPDIMGHSMGGMTATMFSLLYPHLLDRLVVVDIAPRTYPNRFGTEFDALELNVSNAKTRYEIDKKMAEILPDPFIRQFLQMNLEKKDVGYRWKPNVKALREGRSSLVFDAGSLQPFSAKALFILGENSEFIEESDKSIIQNLFPNANIHTIPGAGHYLHYLNADEFLRVSANFLTAS
jgi:pimeloyl-ACP methyl ester carboxylesterase